MKSILKFIAALARPCALLVVFGCAMAVIAAQGGRWSVKLDGFSHFAPIWIAGAVCALIVWLLTGRRGREIPLLVLMTFIGAGALMAPELVAASRQTRSAPAQETVRIVQFNLLMVNEDPDRTAAWIKAQNADVLVLEEVSRDARAIVQRLRADYPYETDCGLRERRCTTKLMSRKPPRPQDPSIQLVSGNGAIAWMTFDGIKGRYDVVGVHYVWPDPIGPQWLNRRSMAQNIRAWPKDSVILTGDFNSTPWSFGLREQDRQLGLERRTRAFFSWPARLGRTPTLPFLAIDQVYAGSQWKTVSLKRGPRLGSDHFPVVIVLTR